MCVAHSLYFLVACLMCYHEMGRCVFACASGNWGGFARNYNGSATVTLM